MDDPNVLVVTYEDLKQVSPPIPQSLRLVAEMEICSQTMFPVLQDLGAGIRRISGFVGFSLTEAQVRQVAAASTFNAMKESSANSHGNMGNVIFRKGHQQ